MKDIIERLRPCLRLPVDGAVTISVEALAEALDEIDRLRGVAATGATLAVADRLDELADTMRGDLGRPPHPGLAVVREAAGALRDCHAAKLRYLGRAEAARAVCLALVRMDADPGDPAYDLPRIIADARRVVEERA